MTTKLLTKLNATAIDGEIKEPLNILQMVHNEPKPGVHVQIALGSGGLVIRRRDRKVSIPLAELLQLAGEHCPEILGLPAQSTINSQPSTS